MRSERQRLQHTIHFADEATPTSKAKPAGVMGAEVWVKVAPVGDPAPGSSPETAMRSLIS